MSSLTQGAPFNDCICILDWNTKDYNDEISIYDKDDSGCCPRGTVPGVQATANYQSAMIVCGFNADGTITGGTSGTQSNAGVCNYEQCYVDKQNLPCAGTGASRQRINGCCNGNSQGSSWGCGDVTQAMRLDYADSAGVTDAATCLGYAYTPETLHSTGSARDYFEYCSHYNSVFSGTTDVGTAATADDIDDGEAGFNTENYGTYERCVGGDMADDDDSGAERLGLSVLIATFAGLAL